VALSPLESYPNSSSALPDKYRMNSFRFLHKILAGIAQPTADPAAQCDRIRRRRFLLGLRIVPVDVLVLRRNLFAMIDYYNVHRRLL
jgi:hypothetical protein